MPRTTKRETVGVGISRLPAACTPSQRIPPSLRQPGARGKMATTSLGHLSAKTHSGASVSSASMQERPVINGIQPLSRTGMRSGRIRTLRRSPAPGTHSHVRPRRLTAGVLPVGNDDRAVRSAILSGGKSQRVGGLRLRMKVNTLADSLCGQRLSEGFSVFQSLK